MSVPHAAILKYTYAHVRTHNKSVLYKPVAGGGGGEKWIWRAGGYGSNEGREKASREGTKWNASCYADSVWRIK